MICPMIAASLRLWRFGYRSFADLALPARPIADELVKLETQQGQQLLFRSAARAAFLPLVSAFETQKNQTYCGVATIVMVLECFGASGTVGCRVWSLSDLYSAERAEWPDRRRRQ